uniref:Uncharacterized protein n=1 Tax=Candidatus Kentrum sp. FW TaxID=2126338 RepID=A0A450TWJ8_9GAMM|nr:MAG: hypothetical protein BECKFW1821C_GA0114237_10507 [Candidatus Kentron sp. FW]
MTHHLILAQSEVTANALGAWLELLGEKPLADDDPRCIVCPEDIRLETIPDVYENLCERIDETVRAGADSISLNRVTVLVDSVDIDELNAISEGGGWNSLIAMLILSFPEIRWVFGVIEGKRSEEKQRIIEWHLLPSLLANWHRDPLFDPTGLRNWIRAKTNVELEKLWGLRVQERDGLAASIDDDKSYAQLHGYIAYRFGYRADVITRWISMKERFRIGVGKKQGSSKNPHGYWLLLEDMSLNFPDRRLAIHLLNLGERARQCPQLDSANPDSENSEHRILITVGRTGLGDNYTLRENRSYLRNKRRGRGKVVLKLTSGLFDLWEQCGLLRKNRRSHRPGDADWFSESRNRLPQSMETEKQHGGHGAQGRLLLLVDQLLDRARIYIRRTITVGEAVRGAVLATDALELSGSKNSTRTIDALSLKHRFEVLAECQFSGIEHHIKIEPRMEEIELEMASISRLSGEKVALNAQMHILNELVRLLREHNQFDEEQVCMRRVRQLHTTLWMRARPWRYGFWPFIRYTEQLLASFPRFLSIVTVWLLVLAALFAWALPQEAVGATGGILERIVLGLESAITSFFSVGAPIYHSIDNAPITLPSWKMVFVSSLAIVSGFLHLGVLITHLYTLVSRR